jgi:hypothetical protein
MDNQETTPVEEEPQFVRELTATDHVNKDLLEKFRRHLENNTIKVPENDAPESGWDSEDDD